jgi:hypothetical protein
MLGRAATFRNSSDAARPGERRDRGRSGSGHTITVQVPFRFAKRARWAGARDGEQQKGGGMTRATVSADGETITVPIPMTFKKRGGRKLVVTPDGAEWAPRPRVDNAMVKALARAFRWWRMLDTGAHGTVEDLATARRLPPSYVSAILRLTLLAPEIVEAVLDGRKRPELQLDHLLEGFPLEWTRQCDTMDNS